jgi:alpha/beta superfamily hydrolase
VASWGNTTTVVVPGASHFFVGRTDRVIDEVDSLLKGL